jgi:2'-5' RNA ligase
MRGFLALEIPQEIITYLGTVSDRLAKRVSDVRWVRNEGIHITVKFLGEIEEGMAGLMRDALVPVGRHHGPVMVRLGQLDAFPTRRSARVVVIKLREGIEAIRAILSEIEERLEAIPVEREKRGLAPHITLGRRRAPKPFPNGDPMPIEEKAFSIDDLVLFKSTLTPGGAIYTPIWKIKLGGENL